VTVRHTGYRDREVRKRKLGRDEAILRAELAERPRDPFVLFNLGFIAVEREDWPAALRDLGASLAGSAPTDSITAKLHALIARCHQGLGDAPAAIAACEAGRREAPDDAELWFREAVVRRQAGDPGGAEACWRRVLTLRRPERFSSVDQGIYGHLTRRNLASLAELRGDPAEALRQWRAVLEECPGDPEATARRDALAAGEGPP
jgi:tetratricopeptide (TPR) repeat protein